MSVKKLHIGSRMSEAVVHNDTIYLAGQVGEGNGITEQTTDMLQAVEKLLAATGSDKSNILSATIWLADMTDFSAMNAVWDAWIDPANPPARACGESKLATPDFLVEIIIVAAKS